MQQDYEAQIEQQGREIEFLQGDLENLKRSNAELAYEGTTVNSEILEAKQTLN